jgi:hypothetical protein
MTLQEAFKKNLSKKSSRDFDRHQQNDKLRFQEPNDENPV